MMTGMSLMLKLFADRSTSIQILGMYYNHYEHWMDEHYNTKTDINF